MELLLFLTAVIVIYIAWSYFMGYRKGNITLDLDNRYTKFSEYKTAIQQELEKQGRTVEYKGNGTFIVDGKEYEMQEVNVPMGGILLQHTVLRRVRK